MTSYRTARILATIVVAMGWLVVGGGIVFFLVSIAKPLAGGVASLYVIASGVVTALFGLLCRAVFDIADATRRSVVPAATAMDDAERRIHRAD